jgi:uncharacterized protein
MKASRTLRTTAIVALSFAAWYLLFRDLRFIKTSLDTWTHQGLVSYVLAYLIVGIPVFIGTWWIRPDRNVFRSLGLSGNAAAGFAAGLLFSLPMFAGGMLFFHFSEEIELQKLIAATLVAGLMEELYFRGFLFGQLFRNTRLGFAPAVAAGALLFALGHLHQGTSPGEVAGVFAVTFMGGVFFAWLYAEWDGNLWVPVFTHAFMNLSWSLFEVDSTALGDVKANVFRGLTIAAAIVFTLIRRKRKGWPPAVNRRTLFFRSSD